MFKCCQLLQQQCVVNVVVIFVMNTSGYVCFSQCVVVGCGVLSSLSKCCQVLQYGTVCCKNAAVIIIDV